MNRLTIRQVQGEISRSTGHRYHALEKACEEMDHQALGDLWRLICALKSAAQSEKNKRRRGQFWG